MYGLHFTCRRQTFTLSASVLRSVHIASHLISSQCLNHRHIKYLLDLLRPIKTAEAFEAVDWLADLPHAPNMAASRPPVECRHFDVILLKSTENF